MATNEMTFPCPRCRVSLNPPLTSFSPRSVHATSQGGKSIWGKKFANEIVDGLTHNARGIVSMANSGKPNTNGSQFFITYAKQPSFNGKYTVFAKVIGGTEVLDLLEKVKTADTPEGQDRPLAEIRIKRVTIHANPLAT